MVSKVLKVSEVLKVLKVSKVPKVLKVPKKERGGFLPPPSDILGSPVISR